MRFPIKITDNFLLEPILHTFGAKPETTYAEIHDGVLEVAMGVWFHERIPLADIAAVAPSEWPWWGGLGVKLAHHGVGVVGTLDGIVNVKLKQPIKMHVVVVVEIAQLWISPADRDGFMAALAEACHLQVGEHVKF